MNHRNPQQNTGFTMIETLVAIFILVVSITGPLAVAQNGLRAAYVARDQTTAFYLAQDALEFVKNIRDSNFIQDNPWLEGFEECMGTDTYCTIDTTEGDITETSVRACPNQTGCELENGLNQNISTKMFGLGSGGAWEESKFYRKLNIRNVEEDQEARITVLVGWVTEDGTERTITVQENIFRWAPIYDNE